jgi:hypothetical protein
MEPVAAAGVAQLQDFPKRECQRRNDGCFLAQDRQAKSKLAGPHASFNVKPDSPKRKRGCREVCMSQRTLHKEDRVHCGGDGSGHGNAGPRQASRQ